jgi:hypothetical protein
MLCILCAPSTTAAGTTQPPTPCPTITLPVGDQLATGMMAPAAGDCERAMIDAGIGTGCDCTLEGAGEDIAATLDAPDAERKEGGRTCAC